MSDLIITVRSVSRNSPKHRVWKHSDGLWHVSRSGRWVGAFSQWDKAIRLAADGKWQL